MERNPYLSAREKLVRAQHCCAPSPHDARRLQAHSFRLPQLLWEANHRLKMVSCFEPKARLPSVD